MRQNDRCILLCSGGMDSTTLAYWMLKQNIRTIPLFLNYGQHCAHKEFSTLQNVLPTELVSNVVTLDIANIYRSSKSRLISEADLWTEHVVADDLYLPYRNLLILSVGAAFAQSIGAGALYAAFINSNHAKEIDCSADFFNKLGELLEDYGAVRIEMPFREMTKYEVAEIGLELGVPITETYSCQVSSDVPCGACPNCADRLEALQRLLSIHSSGQENSNDANI